MARYIRNPEEASKEHGFFADISHGIRAARSPDYKVKRETQKQKESDIAVERDRSYAELVQVTFGNLTPVQLIS